MKWFRMYAEIIDDPKMKQLSDRSFRVFSYLLALAAEAEQGGAIPMAKEDIVWRLRISEKDLDTAINQLSKVGILDGSHPLQFIHWSKRQYKSDDVTERTRRFKEKKNVCGNVPNAKRGTFMGTAPDTDTDTDTETETETETDSDSKRASPVFHDEKAVPPDHSKPKSGGGNGSAEDAFLRNLKTTLAKVEKKFPSPRDQRQVVLFIESNIRCRNPGAIEHCIESLLKAPEIKNIRAYLDAALKIEDGKYNARESEKRNDEFKKMPINLGALIGCIGKRM